MQVIEVAVGVIERSDGTVLVTQRPAQSHLGGLWEFPGGKRELNESRYQALQRELFEEIGIRVSQAEPLIQVVHDYGDRKVLLDVWRVTQFEGVPSACESQSMQWVNRVSLRQLAMPAADRPIIDAIELPAHYVITPQLSGPGFERHYVEGVMQLLQQGYKLIQWRAKHLTPALYQSIGSSLLALCRAANARLVFNASAQTVQTLGGDAIHLTAARAQQYIDRTNALPEHWWVGVSCHSLGDLKIAEQLNANFVVISPIKATQSHPEAKAMGWTECETFVKAAPLPVYALGGLRLEDLPQARRVGAQGIAAIRAFWPESPELKS